MESGKESNPKERRMGSLNNEDEKLDQTVEDSNEPIFYVNGIRRVLPDGLTHLTLLEYLRGSDVGLTGTKLGYGEGGCGACTVMVSQYDRNLNKSLHYAVNACLAPLTIGKTLSKETNCTFIDAETL